MGGVEGEVRNSEMAAASRPGSRCRHGAFDDV